MRSIKISKTASSTGIKGVYGVESGGLKMKIRTEIARDTIDIIIGFL
jgi:hypothetical protein